MAEQPLSSDRETALAPSAPAQRAPPEMPRARSINCSGEQRRLLACAQPQHQAHWK
jgi:hypothetical protein